MHMKKRVFATKITAVLAAMAVAMTLAGFKTMTVRAENFQFITDIRLAEGEKGMTKLEDDGYSVRVVGLNATSEEDNQIYVGYKYNDGDPITGVVVAADAGDSIDVDGIKYSRASKVDVDANNGGGGGCIYTTTDESAGEPLVGLDILRSGTAKNEKLLPITNDGAQIVRHTDGTPADVEVNSDTTIYLAEIRDGIVKPYISKLALVEAENKDGAVYSAAANGFNYYVEGDADTSKDTYTILAYERTADAKDAITNLVALNADLVKKLESGQLTPGEDNKENTASEEQAEADNAAPEEATEETVQGEAEETAGKETGEEVAEETENEENPDEAAEQEVTGEETDETAEQAAAEETPEETVPEETQDEVKKTEADVTVKLQADAVDLSGIEYDRVSSRQIGGDEPFYLYMTKDEKAGNPISMLYIGDSTDASETTFGAWAYGYFASDGPSMANSFVVNEDKLEKVMTSEKKYIRLPLALLAVDEKEAGEGGIKLTAQAMQISLLTAKKGLPDDNLVLNGLVEPTYEVQEIERDAKTHTSDKLPASAFGRATPVVIILGILALAAAVFFGIRETARRKRVLTRGKGNRE